MNYMALAFLAFMLSGSWFEFFHGMWPECTSIEGVRAHGLCWKTKIAILGPVVFETVMFWALVKAL